MTGMVYTRGTTTVVQRGYSYDALGRPLTRTQSRQGGTRNDSFTHNDRSELTAATLGTDAYAYAYDNIGNRLTTQEAAEETTAYTANNLNQYTAIQEGEAEAFVPNYDADGNQTLVKTSTGIWTVTYNAANRPTVFANEATGTVVECSYDSAGRRATKKVTVNGTVTLHQRYIYRGYLQIACCDLTRTAHPCLWLITWDPTQPISTRPLAIQKDGTWYTYGWDLTKNICEVYGQHGYIRTNYSYSPFGEVLANGDVTQPIQWSAEFYDSELDSVYYNYRHYNPQSGRWLRRDYASETADKNLYRFGKSNPILYTDYMGLDVWTENGPTARTMHKRICVETKDVSTCKAPCKGTPRFCISFAPGDGRGSESTSVDSSRSSNSDTLNIDSSAAPEQRGKKKGSPQSKTESNELGLEEGVLAPGITRPTGDPEQDNGHVYIDDGNIWRPWRIWERNYYLKTTCAEDKAIESYFKSLLGIFAPYQLHWNNCRVFSINTFYEIEKKVEEYRKQK